MARLALSVKQAMFDIASEALPKGNVEKLCEIKEAGWNPSMFGRDSVVFKALTDATGASVSWLMEHFPIDCSMSLVARSGQEAMPQLSEKPELNSKSWRLAAMLAFEDFAMEVEGPEMWLRACSFSVDAGDYFEKTLSTNQRWRMQSGQRAYDLWEGARLMFNPILEAPDDRVAVACSAHCVAVASAIASLPGAVDFVEKIDSNVAGLCQKLIHSRRSLRRIESLLPLMKTSSITMQSTVVHMPTNELEWRGVIKKLVHESAPNNHCSKTWSVSSWPLGCLALIRANPDDLALAISRGWIGPVGVTKDQKCENPDYIAHQAEAIRIKTGREVTMEGRWTKCRETLESSVMTESEKNGLLARWEARDPLAWREGQAKVYEVKRRREASPVALLLACSGVNQECDKMMQEKVQMLSVLGFKIKDALSAQDALSQMARCQASSMPWVARLVEREELEESSWSAAPSRRAKTL